MQENVQKHNKNHTQKQRYKSHLLKNASNNDKMIARNANGSSSTPKARENEKKVHALKPAVQGDFSKRETFICRRSANGTQITRSDIKVLVSL
jgi:hypothetical protein